MNKKQKIFKEISDFSDKVFQGRAHFLCIYGSYGSECFTEDSDLDMFVALNRYNDRDFKCVKEFLVDLHERYQMKLDDEVPYENKLIVSYDDVHDAVSLRPFIREHGVYHVPTVHKEKAFLGSPEIRQRLILNALTSPHACIGSDLATYNEYRARAEHAIVRLAHALTEHEAPDEEQLLASLTMGGNGERGELYLGYKNEKEAVRNYLKEVISRQFVSHSI